MILHIACWVLNEGTRKCFENLQKYGSTQKITLGPNIPRIYDFVCLNTEDGAGTVDTPWILCTPLFHLGPGSYRPEGAGEVRDRGQQWVRIQRQAGIRQAVQASFFYSFSPKLMVTHCIASLLNKRVFINRHNLLNMFVSFIAFTCLKAFDNLWALFSQ